MVSHCSTYSLRANYVNELRKYTEEDVYGISGNLTCARNATHWLPDSQCYDLLGSQYKFYLSFENSLCTDYVTEKFFEILYSLRRIQLQCSGSATFVHSRTSLHAKGTGSVFTSVGCWWSLYNEFFWWKDHYEIEAGVEQMARHAFCDLCAKLHEPTEHKSYSSDLVDEWWNKTQCRPVNSSLFSIRMSSWVLTTNNATVPAHCPGPRNIKSIECSWELSSLAQSFLPMQSTDRRCYLCDSSKCYGK